MGCQGRTAPLAIASIPQLDAGPAGTDGGTDGGTVDASVTDAGLVDAGPILIDAGSSNQCRFSNDYAHQISVGAGALTRYEGSARVLSVSPFDLQIGGGDTVRILRGQAGLPYFLEPGENIWLQFFVETPQWTNTAVAISEIDRRGSPGRLRWVSWAFGDIDDVGFEIDDLDLEYEPQMCDPVDFGTGCGLARPEMMVLDRFGATYRIEAGTRTYTRGGEFGNGRSFRYVDGPICTDTPEFWYEGYVRID